MKKVIAILICMIMAMVPATVFASGGDVIRVVPVGSSDTGSAIITGNPASLDFFVTSPQKPASNIWLLLIIDDDTYNNLAQVTLTGTDGPGVVTKADFAGTPADSKIPAASDTHYVGATYPGCTTQTQYQVNAILDQMSLSAGTSLHYVLIFAFDNANITPQQFNINVQTTAPNHVKMLILAQGSIDQDECDPLNSNSPFSGSTFVVPELGTILLVTASFAGLALYGYKRKKN
jgi:hypothetical protein